MGLWGGGFRSNYPQTDRGRTSPNKKWKARTLLAAASTAIALKSQAFLGKQSRLARLTWALIEAAPLPSAQATKITSNLS